MKLKWYGTASILLEHDGTGLLFDPFFPLNDELFQPPLEEMASADYILATHGHVDHLSAIPALVKHDSCKAKVYCTAKPRETLISKGVAEGRIQTIKPFDVLQLGAFEVCVLKGKHIVFDVGTVVRKILSPRVLKYRRNLKHIMRENRDYPEAGETVAFEIKAAGKRILLMGSLNMDSETEYPLGVDLLVLPFQGRSDMCRYAMPFIGQLHPQKVLLTHFDDSFPPITSKVNLAHFVALMREKHPDISVICPQAGREWIL
jgi:L-ascorbate metabolism protein UlaG (beta-lactamase superfamily)